MNSSLACQDISGLGHHFSSFRQEMKLMRNEKDLRYDVVLCLHCFSLKIFQSMQKTKGYAGVVAGKQRETGFWKQGRAAARPQEVSLFLTQKCFCCQVHCSYTCSFFSLIPTIPFLLNFLIQNKVYIYEHMHGNFRIAGAYDRLFLRSEQSLVLSVCTVVRAPSLLQSSEVHTYDSIVNQFAGTFVHAAASVDGRHACMHLLCFLYIYTAQQWPGWPRSHA